MHIYLDSKAFARKQYVLVFFYNWRINEKDAFACIGNISGQYTARAVAR